MAIEEERGCGYRQVGGTYLVGRGLGVSCDRLPLVIPTCTTCGETLRFHRGISEIKPNKLWGQHVVPFPPGRGTFDEPCPDRKRSFGDPICNPPEAAYLMWVGGSNYTPGEFIEEAGRLGVSKRIRTVPRNLVLGQTWVFLAHLKAIEVFKEVDPDQEPLPLGLPPQVSKHQPGVFYAFQPTQVERIITETQSKDEKLMRSLWQQEIVPVVVPDNDLDHNPKAKPDANQVAAAVPAA